MTNNIIPLWDRREGRQEEQIDRDSDTAKSLIKQVYKHIDFILSLLKEWNSNIKDSEQLQVLLDEVRVYCQDFVLDLILKIEVERIQK